MHLLISAAFIFLFSMMSVGSMAQKQQTYDAIYSGIPWFDEGGKIVSAHGANIVKDDGRFYLFGEAHSDTSNAFAGFNCYSSADLYNWKFETVALPAQQSGKLGPNRVGERVKVMKCLKTGEYVMLMHVDSLNYKDQFTGYATAKNITGPYTFQGPLLFNGNPIHKWDMGSFQDTDGAGYLLIHGGEIYKLSDDYKSVTEQVNKSMTAGFESPAIFRRDSLYYFLGSNLTSWEKNDNYYYTATSLKGPWTNRGLFCPQGSLTWNSQTSFVLPIEGSKETTYLFMGDRWSFPKQASAATYVWQPLVVSGTTLSIPAYHDAWRINIATGVNSPTTIPGETINLNNKKLITYSGKWQPDSLSTTSSDEKNASLKLKFKGTRIGLFAVSHPAGGYATLQLRNSKGKIIYKSIIDMYSLAPVKSLKFLSPLLAKGSYTFTVTVMKERGNWSDKRKSNYGSTGYFVSLDKIVIGN